MTKAFVFPGQGTSLFVGMGKEIYDAFPSAREVFEEVNDALGQNLQKLAFEGPEETLSLTENAQPALMCVSRAILKALEVEVGISLDAQAAYVAGHSLGEYSALCAAGTFSLHDTAKLLKIRGTAMQKAVPVGAGAMAAVLGLTFEQVEEVTREAAGNEICSVANDNATGQVVISGDKAAVERAAALASEKGAKRSVMLPVSAPFHCALMKPAAEEMAKALEGIEMNAPSVPLIANVTADVVKDAETIKSLLVEQVTGQVRWRESVLKMQELGVETLVEIGSGKVLSGLLRRIAPDMKAINIEKPEDFEKLA